MPFQPRCSPLLPFEYSIFKEIELCKIGQTRHGKKVSEFSRQQGDSRGVGTPVSAFPISDFPFFIIPLTWPSKIPDRLPPIIQSKIPIPNSKIINFDPRTLVSRQSFEDPRHVRDLTVSRKRIKFTLNALSEPDFIFLTWRLSINQAPAWIFTFLKFCQSGTNL